MIAAAGAAVLAGSSVLCIRAAFRAGERARLIDRAHAGRSVGVREGAVPGSVMSVVRDRADTWAPALSCLLGLAVGVVLAGVPGAIVGAGGGLAFTVALRHRRTARNRSRLEEQLVDGVVALTAGLRAGMSVPQSLEYAADECDAPLGPSLRAVVDRASMGEPFGTALAAWGREHGGGDARLVVGVLGMHRRSGGDLPGVLDRLAATLRDRRAAARELRSLTAQARMSGAILGLLPIGFFGFLALTAPDDLSVALAAPAGRAAIAVGFVLQGAAFVWIRRLLRVA